MPLPVAVNCCEEAPDARPLERIPLAVETDTGRIAPEDAVEIDRGTADTDVVPLPVTANGCEEAPDEGTPEGMPLAVGIETGRIVPEGTVETSGDTGITVGVFSFWMGDTSEDETPGSKPVEMV